MQKHFIITSFLILLYTITGHSQYKFSGTVSRDHNQEHISLSLIEDYRKTTGIYHEQIIQQTTIDSAGNFSFIGNNFPKHNHIYRIHTENCEKENSNRLHLNGKCPLSKEILFIASQNDSITFPINADNEIFCSVQSNNEKNQLLIKMDSLIEQLQYDLSGYRSKANRQITLNKWFETIKKIGKQTDEPLAELYLYTFISDKSNELYDYYLNDLQKSSYYLELKDRLRSNYSNTRYASQYSNEIAADLFLIAPTEHLSVKWFWILASLLGCSILLNIYLLFVRKKDNEIIQPAGLTQQEEKILHLILENKTNKEIATLMFVSLSTVKTHINNLYKKLGVSSRDTVKEKFGSQ